MNLADNPISANSQWMWLVFGLILAKTLWSAPWQILKKPGILNLMLGKR